ncbi:MAG: sulfurtransferase [Actinomycetota bacterium]|nr:sulfurtransferase [Actinomycetota bacterium]
MSYRTIITPQQLQELSQASSDLVVLDARFNLDDEDWGDRAFTEGHIPGAQRADLARHLAGEIVEGKTGRRPFPDPEVFAETIRSWGIGPNTQVVVYDADRGLMAASRVWFMLRWMGLNNVAVLDGGLPAWEEEGLPLTAEVVSLPASSFEPNVREEMVAYVDEVDAIRESVPARVFDSRGPEGYHGQGKYYDPVRGHIKGAGLADRAETITDDGRFRSPEQLRTHYDALRAGQDASEIVFYCGSGVTAAQNVLAMEHAGLPGARMYVGSWSEWIIDPSREVEL